MLITHPEEKFTVLDLDRIEIQSPSHAKHLELVRALMVSGYGFVKASELAIAVERITKGLESLKPTINSLGINTSEAAFFTGAVDEIRAIAEQEGDHGFVKAAQPRSRLSELLRQSLH